MITLSTKRILMVYINSAFV